eukprot:m.1247388 g.1247388  ORF g.1247388 m.1247388 type:complete len:486 (+) comp24690_c1_seq23:527-1984(+)
MDCHICDRVFLWQSPNSTNPSKGTNGSGSSKNTPNSWFLGLLGFAWFLGLIECVACGNVHLQRSVEDFYAEEEWKDGRENAQGLVDILLAKVAVGPTNQNDDSNNTTSADHKPANVTSREMACVFRTSRMPGAPSVRPKLKIVAVGDTSFARDILGWGEAQYKGNMSYVFEKVKPFWSDADLVIVNLESPFFPSKEDGAAKEKDAGIMLGGSSQGAIALKMAGVTVATLANNHVLDLGRNGLRSTTRALQDQGILPIGIENREYGNAYGMITIKGIRIAIFAFCNLYACESKTRRMGYGAGALNEEAFSRLAAMRKNVDILIVAVHWGLEYVTTVEFQRQATAKRLAAVGVDLVIGHHPHVLQDHAIYGKTFTGFSLGNFIFDSHVCRDAQGLLTEESMKASPGCARMHQSKRVAIAHAIRETRIYSFTVSKMGVHGASYLPCSIGSELTNATRRASPIYRPVPHPGATWTRVCGEDDPYCLACE